ncbi:MAG: Hpt domain-containing protein [Synechococcus sp.]
MDRAVQERIMGFYIEEARELTVTLEQGLPRLQELASDKLALDELVRAAHSIKGGAAMLGIGSIEKTAHHMERALDTFRKRKVAIDSELISLLLRCHESLAVLVNKLQSPEGLSAEAGEAEIAQVQPVFEELDRHMQVLLGNIPARATPAKTTTQFSPIPSTLRQSPSKQATRQKPAPSTSKQSSSKQEAVLKTAASPLNQKTPSDRGFFWQSLRRFGTDISIRFKHLLNRYRA